LSLFLFLFLFLSPFLPLPLPPSPSAAGCRARGLGGARTMGFGLPRGEISPVPVDDGFEDLLLRAEEKLDALGTAIAHGVRDRDREGVERVRVARASQIEIAGERFRKIDPRPSEASAVDERSGLRAHASMEARIAQVIDERSVGAADREGVEEEGKVFAPGHRDEEVDEETGGETVGAIAARAALEDDALASDPERC